MTVSNLTGDGVATTLIQASIELPDSGTTVPVAGQVQQPGQAAQALTGSPVTIPAPPGSGSIFYIIQASVTTGALSVKQSASGMPSADAGNTVIFQQTLVPSSTDPAFDAATTTPDSF